MLGSGQEMSLVHYHSSQVSSSDPDAPPRPVGHPWRVVAAVCVQRFPILSREKLELELRYEALKDIMREERSRLSDFELEELEHNQKKRERERRALEEDLDERQVDPFVLYNLLKILQVIKNWHRNEADTSNGSN